MAKKIDFDTAIEKIDEAGVLLIFPMANQKEPASLWSQFFPRTPMRWEWDESGDTRVSDLWHLRADLSECGDVVYCKWFKGRATVFSRPLFAAFLRYLGTSSQEQIPLNGTATQILDILREDSPQSPRVLREALDLQGKPFEAQFNKGLKDLWRRLLLVGFGEIDDGAFPSLALGSSHLLYEDLWDEAKAMSFSESEKVIQKILMPDNQFYKYLLRTRQQLQVDDITT